MSRGEKAIFANMCMVYDNDGNVLVLNRKDPKWPGIIFPGGHVEEKESFVDSTIREIYEETGLTIKDLQICGVKQFRVKDDQRYVVFLYKTNQYTGQINSSEEGEVYWMKFDDILDHPIASGFDKMLEVYDKEDLTEIYYYEDESGWECKLL